MREADNCPLSAAVPSCNPFNLVTADEDFCIGFNNVYDRALVRSLRRTLKSMNFCFKVLVVNIISLWKSMQGLDEGLTRVSFGFKSVDDYYFNSSSSNFNKNVRTPLLCIQAANDPMAPSRGIPHHDIKENPNCLLIVTPQGGHLGWIAGDEVLFKAPWTDPVVMEFLEYVDKESDQGTEISYHNQQDLHSSPSASVLIR